MLSFQCLIPSKPFFSPLNPKPKTLIKPPLRLSNLNPLAKKKQSDLVNENSNQDKLDEKGTTLRDGGVEKSEPPINPLIKPRKKRRGRRSEAQAVEDHVRNQLEQTFSSIREKNPGLLENMHAILKDKPAESTIDEEGEEKEGEQQDEEDPEWPVDADKGWGIRASEYFDKHSIKNVVDNGVEIDWEGEIEEGWVKEINCLEWESFAFHPSPLIVLVFERYNRPSHNWKFLKELESAAKVYWSSKDHLPPRTVKLDVNIETDLAYALKVKETDCPQLLFLRGNHIMYREKEIRSSDELVKMIAHFYYNAKRPDWINSAHNTRV